MAARGSPRLDQGDGAVGILLLQRVPNEPEILQTLMADEMCDQRVRVGGFVPLLGRGGQTPIALSVVLHLVVPGWAERLERYQTLMDALLAR